MSCSANAKDNMSVINVFKHSIRTQNLNNNPSLSKLVSKSKLVPKKTGQSSIRKMSINKSLWLKNSVNILIHS